MTRFDKLVRDGIPDIIRATGREPSVRLLSEDTDYVRALVDKLAEEGAELLAADAASFLDELADLYEVVRALAAAHETDLTEVEQRADVKAGKRGGFAGRLFLESVGDELP